MTGNAGVASSPVRVSVDPGRSADFGSARRNSTGLYGGEPFHILTVFLGTGCMIKLQSSMSKHIPPFLVQIAQGIVFYRRRTCCPCLQASVVRRRPIFAERASLTFLTR
ncbi:hypothetical protein ILYODFUR_014072 [Ilyodon furcidens]|uniref:Uncharacterized protein n=1 Tax=Ilyodon furcidens TaxID=33524 RepID=A0ABV0UT53_9TELE